MDFSATENESESDERRRWLLGGSQCLGLGLTQERFGHWLGIGFGSLSQLNTKTPGLVIRGKSTQYSRPTYHLRHTRSGVEWSGLTTES